MDDETRLKYERMELALRALIQQPFSQVVVKNAQAAVNTVPIQLIKELTTLRKFIKDLPQLLSDAIGDTPHHHSALTALKTVYARSAQ